MLALALALAALVGPAAADLPQAAVRAHALTSQAKDARIPNLRPVEDGLYRSGRPGRAAFGRLAGLGIKTILDLEGPGEAESERRLAAPYPEMKVYNVPLSGLSEPSFASLDRALTVLVSAPRPILVHCKHGQDRTGVVVAAYESAVRGRPARDAAGEARALHCCHLVTDDLAGLLDRYVAYRAGR